MKHAFFIEAVAQGLQSGRPHNSPGKITPAEFTAQHQFAPSDQVSPAMTTSDQGCGSEFLSKVMDKCAYERGSKLPELGAWISR
jgi:hypothetical protein